MRWHDTTPPVKIIRVDKLRMSNNKKIPTEGCTSSDDKNNERR